MSNAAYKDGSTWRIPTKGIQYKDGSDWRQIKTVEYNDGGTWRTVFNVYVAPLTITNTSGSVAAVNFFTDGRFIWSADNVDTTVNWLYPTTGGAGTGHWCRCTVQSGDVPDAGSSAVSTWLQISTTRAWGYTASPRSGVWRLEVATDSGGANIISVADFTMAFA